MRQFRSLIFISIALLSGPLYATYRHDFNAPYILSDAQKVIGETTPRIRVRLTIPYLRERGMENFAGVDRFENLVWAFTQFMGPRGVSARGVWTGNGDRVDEIKAP